MVTWLSNKTFLMKYKKKMNWKVYLINLQTCIPENGSDVIVRPFFFGCDLDQSKKSLSFISKIIYFWILIFLEYFQNVPHLILPIKNALFSQRFLFTRFCLRTSFIITWHFMTNDISVKEQFLCQLMMNWWLKVQILPA